MADLTIMVYLRILSGISCLDLENPFGRFGEALDPDPKWQKALLATIKAQAHGRKVRPKFFAPNPRLGENLQTPVAATRPMF